MTWKPTKLSSITDVITKGTTPTTLGYEFVDEGIPFLRVQNISEGSVNYDRDTLFIDSETHSALKRSQIQPGDVLVSIAGSIGRAGVVPDDAPPMNCNQAVAILRPTAAVHKPFLRLWIEGADAQRQIGSSTVTGTISNLSLSQLGNLEIPLPPLAEQRRIAEVLDLAEALRAKRRAALAQLDSFTQALFLNLFGDPVFNPIGWEVKKLKDISTKILNGTTPKGGKQVYKQSGIQFFRSQNVWRNIITLEDIAYLDESTHRKMKKSSLRYKDILITKTGRINTENSSLGRAALFLGRDGSANINGHVYLVRLGKDIIPEFVLFILTTNEYREYIRRVCVGGIDKRQINKEHLNEFPIISPPLGLQRRFAAIVESVERQKTRQRASLSELDALFATLQRRAFRGEL